MYYLYIIMNIIKIYKSGDKLKKKKLENNFIKLI